MLPAKGSIEAGSSSNSAGGRGASVVSDVGRRKSSCGYCKSGGHTSVSHGLWAFSLSVDDYQDLLDRGWRRSGCFLYKPEMENTCCPSYTIRLKACDYVPSKEQSRVFRRMQRFLDGALDGKKLHESTTSGASGSCDHGQISITLKEPLVDEEKNKEEQFRHFLSDKLDNAVGECTRSGELPHPIVFPKASVKKVSQAKQKLLVQGSENLLYSSNISFQIAANLKRAKRDERDVDKSSMPGYNAEKKGLLTEYSADNIAEKVANSLIQLEGSDLSVRACKGHINFYSGPRQASLAEGLEKKSVAEGSPIGCGSKRSCPKKNPEHACGKRRKLEIHLKRSSFDPEEYALYRRYQLKVHNDTPDCITEESYKRFLIDSPLVYVPSTGDGTVPPCGFGSFHQQYLIDGRLIAVGVIDILPKCLSSKYLFWDPDFAFLSLGKYSAIQEIGWVKENQALCPSLQYYYLGYYIHSCLKMRYKAAYYPSELLCPLRYQWVQFKIAKPLLDVKRYAVLSDFSTSQNDVSSRLSHADEGLMEQHNELAQDDSNDSLTDNDEEMYDHDHDSAVSDDETDTESISESEVDDVSNVLVGVWKTHRQFEVVREVLRPADRSYLETRLRRYVRAVGAELSKRMVYSLEF